MRNRCRQPSSSCRRASSGLLHRTVYPEVPPRVEYRLTASAENLIPVWKALEQWGDAHREDRRLL